jgi:HEAT repeat protein/PBS lyase HEAT-like repeat-containing protein
MRCTALFLVLLLMQGCTNVTQMQRQYEAGDESQLARLLEIAGRSDYPYGTRRKAARALGEIGDPRAVPVLTSLLFDYEQRITLKEEALVALAAIGDPKAVTPIGRMLDTQLGEEHGELRMAAIDALGTLGGVEAAGILVNALRYYDMMFLRRKQMSYRGVFTGEERLRPYGQGQASGHPDSTRSARPMVPMMGGYGPDDQAMPVSMFGTRMEMPLVRNETLEEEHELARAALIRVGEPAVAVIDQFLYDHETSQALARELGEVVLAIRMADGAQDGPTSAASASTADGAATTASATTADGAALADSVSTSPSLPASTLPVEPSQAPSAP